jgi:antirestriction protein ArdC
MTDLILSQVDSAGEWKMPWRGKRGGGMPINYTTGKHYRGINILSCWVGDMIGDYPTSEWASFKQWEAKGGRVRKGEKGTPIIFYKVAEKKDNPDEKYRMAQAEAETFEPIDEATRIARIEHWIMERKPTVRIEHKENRAYFAPLQDHVNMPDFGAFVSAELYYGTLFHEMTHWTGHKARLDRKCQYSDTKERAAEELVAEIGASFLCAEFGIEQHTREDHVNYIAGWMQALKDDKRAIVTAASAASKAVDYLQAIEPARLAA